MNVLKVLVVAAIGLGPVSGLAQSGLRTYVVAADGSGDYRTVQDAVTSGSGEAGIVLRIKPGVYREKLHIARDHVSLEGMGGSPADVVLTYDDSAKMAGGTSKSASVTVTGNDFEARNLTIQNDWEKKNRADW